MVAEWAAGGVAPEPADPKVLIANFEKLARAHGLEAFQEMWNQLPAATRKAIGVAERDRIAAIGREHDATAEPAAT